MNLVKTITSDSNIKLVFSDFYDTIVHRKVHPNYPIKIWAKHIIREYGLNLSSEELYSIRMESLDFISASLGLRRVEVGYEKVIAEVFKRLNNNDLISKKTVFENFLKSCEEADYRSEIGVQFLNKKVIKQLLHLKELGYQIHLISDFHLPEEIIKRILKFHEIDTIFSCVYISSSISKSKEKGTLYDYALLNLQVAPNEAVMVGDNKKSDVINASKYNIKGIFLKHSKHKIRNKLNLFGSDSSDFKRVAKNIEKKCNKGNYPFSEYIIFFYVFIERLYHEAQKNNIKNLFFLAREGGYLKTLFDHYQTTVQLNPRNKINTHYLKISRQSAMQIALKELEFEDFGYLREKYGIMSSTTFLKNFLFPDDVISEITKDAGLDKDLVVESFATSDAMEKLRQSKVFNSYYEKNRLSQKQAFNSYLNSFDTNIQKEGMYIVDVGWGGGMQQWLNEYFQNKIAVNGFYLGLKKVYHITTQTKRYGLNFSVYPSTCYNDTILMANSQLYEQLLAAPHGSTLGYKIGKESFSIEHHQENEKLVYEKNIKNTQEQMFSTYEELLQKLDTKCYRTEKVQDFMTKLAMRIALFTSNKKLKFLKSVSKGFYQNIGNNRLGVVYDPKSIGMSKIKFLKEVIFFPERTLKFIAKVKPVLYNKGYKIIAILITPFLGLFYYHLQLNKYLRKLFFSKGLL